MKNQGIVIATTLSLTVFAYSMAQAETAKQPSIRHAIIEDSQNHQDNAPIDFDLPYGPVQFGNKTKSADKTFKQADANGDNKLSFDEIFNFEQTMEQARKQKEFERMTKNCDKNRDNIISKDEMGKIDALFGLPDPDEPGAYENFNPGELEKRLEKECMLPDFALDVMDINEDGVLTMDELKQSIMSGRPPNKKMEQKVERKIFKREARRMKKQFSKCDINGDQLLSLREIVSMKCGMHMFTEEFDARDKDRNQLLTVQELTTFVDPTQFQPKIPGMSPQRRKKMPPLMQLKFAIHECDKNQDGQLAKNETIDAGCEIDPVFFDTVDHDQDGIIRQEELKRMSQKKRFDLQDKNKDSYLDFNEFSKSAFQYQL